MEILCSFNLPRISAALERLMGTNVVRLTDRIYMKELRERIDFDYRQQLQKRIRAREVSESGGKEDKFIITTNSLKLVERNWTGAPFDYRRIEHGNSPGAGKRPNFCSHREGGHWHQKDSSKGITIYHRETTPSAYFFREISLLRDFRIFSWKRTGKRTRNAWNFKEWSGNVNDCSTRRANMPVFTRSRSDKSNKRLWRKNSRPRMLWLEWIFYGTKTKTCSIMPNFCNHFTFNFNF